MFGVCRDQNITKCDVLVPQKIFHFHGRKWHIFDCCCVFALSRSFPIDCYVFMWWNPPLEWVSTTWLGLTGPSQYCQLKIQDFLLARHGHFVAPNTTTDPYRPPSIDCYVTGQWEAACGGRRVPLTPSTTNVSIRSLFFDPNSSSMVLTGRDNQPEPDPQRHTISSLMCWLKDCSVWGGVDAAVVRCLRCCQSGRKVERPARVDDDGLLYVSQPKNGVRG